MDMRELKQRVILGLKCCKDYIDRNCDNCPYEKDCYRNGPCELLLKNAYTIITLIKDDENEQSNKM